MDIAPEDGCRASIDKHSSLRTFMAENQRDGGHTVIMSFGSCAWRESQRDAKNKPKEPETIAD
eukprot:6464253-Amphidinium_carterae.1